MQAATRIVKSNSLVYLTTKDKRFPINDKTRSTSYQKRAISSIRHDQNDRSRPPPGNRVHQCYQSPKFRVKSSVSEFREFGCAPPCPSGLERLVLRSRLVRPALPLATNPWPAVLQDVRTWRSQPTDSHPAARIIGNESDASVDFPVPRQSPKVARPPPFPSVPRPGGFGRRQIDSEPTIRIPELGPLFSLVIDRRMRQVRERNWSLVLRFTKIPMSLGSMFQIDLGSLLG